MFSRYFNEEFRFLEPKTRVDIDSLLSDEMIVISGDFYGIQKFIFERLSAKNAAKVLRAKSAYVELFMITLARFVCHKLEISEKHIISINAGKFEIISSNKNISIIENIQRTVDRFFVKNFYGLSGVNLSCVECKKDDFSERNYRNLREKIAQDIEAKKFKKFDLLSFENSVLEYETEITNQTLCGICNIRKKSKENCEICNMFVELGKALVHKKESLSSKADLLIELDGFDTRIKLDEKITSYISKGDSNEPITFDKLAKNSCKDIETGIKALGILKADVDNMGKFLKNSDATSSFANFETFSKTLDAFFAIHIPRVMAKDFPDTYTVFAGGDDLFLVGSWDEIVLLARFVESEFKRFIKNKDLSISVAVVIAKSSTPIGYLSEYVENQLEKAKSMDGKDSIAFMEKCSKWDSYKEVHKSLGSVLEELAKDINTAFLYRLLTFCDMSQNSKVDIEDTMWRSRFRYSVARNNTNLSREGIELIANSIENRPEQTRMVLSEFIYKRRERA